MRLLAFLLPPLVLTVAGVSRAQSAPLPPPPPPPAGAAAPPPAPAQPALLAPPPPPGQAASPVAPGPPATRPAPPYAPYGYAPYTPHPPAVPQTESRWYGWQTLIADGVSLAALGVGIGGAGPGVGGLGVTGLFLGAPIIHWGHGHAGKGFGSLALRVLPPLVGTLLVLDGCGSGCFDGGDGKNSSGHSDFEQTLGVLLLVAWLPTAISVDAAALAYEDVPVRPSAVTWTPSVTPVRGGATLGASGTF